MNNYASRSIEEQADMEANAARQQYGTSRGVFCAVTGKAPGVNGDHGAAWCSCVGCTVWRSREDSAVVVPVKVTWEFNANMSREEVNKALAGQRGAQ